MTYKIKLLLDIPAGSLLRTDVLPAVLLLLYYYKGNGNETTACALPTPAWQLATVCYRRTRDFVVYICIISEPFALKYDLIVTMIM